MSLLFSVPPQPCHCFGDCHSFRDCHCFFQCLVDTFTSPLSDSCRSRFPGPASNSAAIKSSSLPTGEWTLRTEHLTRPLLYLTRPISYLRRPAWSLLNSNRVTCHCFGDCHCFFRYPFSPVTALETVIPLETVTAIEKIRYLGPFAFNRVRSVKSACATLVRS